MEFSERSPARGKLAEARGELRRQTCSPPLALGIYASLEGLGVVYATRSQFSFRKRSVMCRAGTGGGPGEVAWGRGASPLLKNTSSP